jgi:hypothetical protein
MLTVAGTFSVPDVDTDNGPAPARVKLVSITDAIDGKLLPLLTDVREGHNVCVCMEDIPEIENERPSSMSNSHA